MKNTSLLFAAGLIIVAGQVATGQELSQRDQLHIAVQGICPVSGQKLGAHGQPIKAKIGNEDIFLCCKGCLNGQVKQEHWATIHANFARAQGKCPVMKRPLPANPKWTIVGGRIVYVCCPPCTKKIAADPGKYLEVVDQFYQASLKAADGAHR